ncbi:hypothetical protein LX97_03241 [Nonlabens dokdonensis]|uniref:Uncharacterized protein n=1 Tax=Nonlabens dokdonensis TaxID=328515 RepID=A0ABX5PTV4_9FLAO|nr:hypothetical protein LX97_03241 [Nonlabens dokdonensis]
MKVKSHNGYFDINLNRFVLELGKFSEARVDRFLLSKSLYRNSQSDKQFDSCNQYRNYHNSLETLNRHV